MQHHVAANPSKIKVTGGATTPAHHRVEEKVKSRVLLLRSPFHKLGVKGGGQLIEMQSVQFSVPGPPDASLECNIPLFDV